MTPSGSQGETLEEQHQRLLVETENYVDLIQKQKEKVAKVEAKMRAMQGVIWQRKKLLGGMSTTLSRPLQQIKHIRVLEDRLNQATTRFDKQLTRNRSLREQLAHLRQQHGLMSSLYHRLDKEVLVQHHIMDELVEKSVHAYDQRSEALARMLALRERSKKDAAQGQIEMTELQRVIDHETKLRTFMAQKTQESFPPFDDEARRRKAELSQRERMGGESLETYQAVHQRIVAVTGERDLRKLATTFVENEEKSFTYFSFINELNNKSTTLMDQINRLKMEIEHFEQRNKHHEGHWERQLKELEANLEKKRSEANDMEAQHKLVCKSLDHMKTAIADLFNRMNCDSSPITGKLGSSAEVSDDNVTLFIGILEESLSKQLMMMMQASFERSETMELPARNMLLDSCGLLPSLKPSMVEPPSAISFEDPTLDSLQEPGAEKTLDYENLCEHARKRVVLWEQGKGPKPASASTAPRGKKKMGFSGPKSA